MKGLLFLNGEPPTATTLENIDFEGCFVVCADGAYNYLKDYCVPDIFVGDFDSFCNGEIVVRAKKIVRLPTDKDFTDGHIAMLQLITAEPDYIEILGGSGRAPDHELANYSLLYLASESRIPAKIMSETHQIHLVRGYCSNFVASGQTSSETDKSFHAEHIECCEELNKNGHFSGNNEPSPVGFVAERGSISERVATKPTVFSAKARVGARVSVVPFSDSVHIIKTRGLKYCIKNETYGKLHIKGISNEAIQDEIQIEVSGGAALVFIEN